MIRNLIRRARFARAYAILAAMDVEMRLKSIGHAPVEHWREPYDGQPILLLALYQKGQLREDTRVLLAAARAAGYYVVAVNSLAAQRDDGLRDAIDCYIERFNYGRDFGSYKTGMLAILDDPELSRTPRLLLMNDSVFVCRNRIAPFLETMRDADVEVLGSTENYEISHHLGSFCLSMAGDVLRHDRMQRFWRRYRVTDLRPLTIWRGEMGLSKALRGSVSAEDQVTALYDAGRLHSRLREDRAFLEAVVEQARSSNLTGWKRLSIQKAVKKYAKAYLRPVMDEAQVLVDSAGAPTEPMREFRLASLADARDYLERLTGGQDVYDHFMEFLIGEATAVFMSGSQIHQNNAVLVSMGLPIVKLDGLYRGMFSIRDIDLILRQLGPDDAERLRAMLFRRPYGGDTLKGWRLDAFLTGLI